MLPTRDRHHESLREYDTEYDSLKRGRPVQGQRARSLHSVRAFPRVLVDYPNSLDFKLISSITRSSSSPWITTTESFLKDPPRDKRIVLIKVGEHYHGCNSLPGFLGSSHFCVDCETSFEHDDEHHHPCQGKKCPACFHTHCPDKGNPTATHPCSSCHRIFLGEQCLTNHRDFTTVDGKKANAKHPNVCATVRRCGRCLRRLSDYELRKKHHVCGTAECPSCREYHNLHQHRCYIQNPIKLQEKRKKSRKRKANRERVEKDKLFVYWDSETMQDTGVHVPNLVCAATSNCDELFHFEGATCIRDFLDWLRELARDSELTVLAHNSQGFDSHLILDELYKQYVVPDQIVNGAKILTMSINEGKIVFQDSLCFFQMPLSAFPKAFGLVKHKKGFFPHFFNTPDHQTYVSPLPDKEYYDPKGMSVERTAEFERW